MKSVIKWKYFMDACRKTEITSNVSDSTVLKLQKNTSCWQVQYNVSCQLNLIFMFYRLQHTTVWLDSSQTNTTTDASSASAKAKGRNVVIFVSCERDGSGHRHRDKLVENYLLCILHSASRLIVCHRAVLEKVKLDLCIVIF